MGKMQSVVRLDNIYAKQSKAGNLFRKKKKIRAFKNSLLNLELLNLHWAIQT